MRRKAGRHAANGSFLLEELACDGERLCHQRRVDTAPLAKGILPHLVFQAKDLVAGHLRFRRHHSNTFLFCNDLEGLVRALLIKCDRRVLRLDELFDQVWMGRPPGGFDEGEAIDRRLLLHVQVRTKDDAILMGDGVKSRRSC